MRRTVSTLAILVALAAGCGGDDAAAPAAADDAADVTVTIADFSFGDVPTASAGQTITVVNDDGAPHTMTADDGTFDTGTLGQGESATIVVDDAGEYAFRCSIHPDMTGTLVVEG